MNAASTTGPRVPGADTGPGSRSRVASPGPPPAFSSLDRLFSRSAALDSNPHASRKDAAAELTSFINPISVLSNLMDTLREHKIPGPRLLRLKTEFTTILGYGAQFEVYGLDDQFVSITEHLAGQGAIDPEKPLLPVRELTTIAVKRSRASGTREKSRRTSPGSEEFIFQCKAAHREIDALCHKSFQEHANIVRLLSWGLCLDSLEDNDEESPRIPLLVLERAQCNLLQFLARPAQYCPTLKYNDLRRICLDIGHGLDAIHGRFMAHGDLKPENVLLFRNPGKHAKWRAKLCDFGLSVMETSEVDSERYRGTPGWCPPEAYNQESTPLSARDHQRCDVFAYGLVVWSTFVYGGRPPLADCEEQGEAFDLATKQLTKHPSIPKHEHRRIILTVQGALLSDPMMRRRKPWKVLDRQRYSRVGKRIKFLRDLARETFPIRRTLIDYAGKFWRGISSQDFSGIFCCRSTSPSTSQEPIRKLGHKLERNQVYGTTVENYKRTLSQRGPLHGPNTFGHSPKQRCLNLGESVKLHDRMFDAIRDKKASLVYAFARLRSQIQLCCWVRIRNGRPINMVARLLETKHEFVSLAWMCHGEVGEYELRRESPPGMIFSCTYTLPSSFAYQVMRRELLAVFEKVNVFMVLLEHGGHIESSTNFQGDTVFFRLLKASNKYKKNGYGDMRVDEICASFARIARKPCVSSKSRHYMTGTLPSTAEDMRSFVTTALHDSVRANNYSAVESLVRSGFSVSALNKQGKTALDMAHELRVSSLDRKAGGETKTNLYRIIALLQQNSRQTISADSPRNINLPLGWELYKDPQSRFSIFHDYLSRSVTFIQPKFSLYQDRRLDLAGRRFSADNQTYYVDLMRFISPSTLEDEDEVIEISLPTYDEEWFRTEPRKAEEGADDEGANAAKTVVKDVAVIRAHRHRISGRGRFFPSTETLLPPRESSTGRRISN